MNNFGNIDDGLIDNFVNNIINGIDGLIMRMILGISKEWWGVVLEDRNLNNLDEE